MPVRGNVDAVDKAQIVDIHRDFGIVNLLERVDHRLVQRPARLTARNRRRRLREEAFEIIAFALERLGRTLDARLGRRLQDRKSDVEGKSVSVGGDRGGGGIFKKKKLKKRK